jgi:SAM-dependent methyltransferase
MRNVHPCLVVFSTMTRPPSCPKNQDEITREWNSAAQHYDDYAAVFVRWLFHTLFLPTVQDKELFPTQTEPASITLLDFGCGTGLFVELLLRNEKMLPFVLKQVTALDVSHVMIHLLGEKLLSNEWNDRVTPICGSILDKKQQAALRSHGFEIVVAINVLSLIPPTDIQPTMRILGELLKPGGHFIHVDWANESMGFNVQNTMSMDQARVLYEFSGLSSDSLSTTPFTQPNTGEIDGESPKTDVPAVVFGVARRPHQQRDSED